MNIFQDAFVNRIKHALYISKPVFDKAKAEGNDELYMILNEARMNQKVLMTLLTYADLNNPVIKELFNHELVG